MSALLARYRCKVTDRLRHAHDYGDPAVDEDRYLILSLPAHPGSYVQCVFEDRNTRFSCEAASGYFLEPEDTPRTMRLKPEAIAALGRLGFSTVEHEDDFHQTLAVPDGPDYAALATLMLTALHVGYDADARSRIEFDAPDAPANRRPAVQRRRPLDPPPESRRAPHILPSPASRVIGSASTGHRRDGARCNATRDDG